MARCGPAGGLDAEGLECGVGRDQRDALAVAGLAPDRIAAAGLDLRDEASGEEGAHDLLGGAALQPLGKRQDDAVRALAGGAEDHELDVGELGHGVVSLLRRPGPSRPSYDPRAARRVAARPAKHRETFDDRVGRNALAGAEAKRISGLVHCFRRMMAQLG